MAKQKPSIKLTQDQIEALEKLALDLNNQPSNANIPNVDAQTLLNEILSQCVPKVMLKSNGKIFLIPGKHKY